MATSRSGYLSEYTADGNFRHYLFHLQEDVLSLIPPADKNKALLQAKWKSAIGHAFNAFTDKRTMHKTAAEIVEVITEKVAEIATEAHGHGHHRGLWCESITMADLQAMIYRPAYASCLKHHDSLAMNSADPGLGIQFICRLRDFSNPGGAGAIHKAKEDLRNLKFHDTNPDDTRVNFIKHIEKFLSIIETINRLDGVDMEGHQQMFYFNESLPETSSFLSLSRRLEEHSANKTSTWELEKAYALQYVQTKSFKSSVKEQAHFAMIAQAQEETAMYAKRKAAWAPSQRKCVWCKGGHYDNDCKSDKATKFYEDMVKRKASGLKGLELTDFQTAKAIAVQQALMAINNYDEQDNHHLTDTADHCGAVADEQLEFGFGGISEPVTTSPVAGATPDWWDDETPPNFRNPSTSRKLDSVSADTAAPESASRFKYFGVGAGVKRGVYSSYNVAVADIDAEGFKTIKGFNDLNRAQRYITLWDSPDELASDLAAEKRRVTAAKRKEFQHFKSDEVIKAEEEIEAAQNSVPTAPSDHAALITTGLTVTLLSLIVCCVYPNLMIQHIESVFQCLCAIGVSHFAMPATTWARSRLRQFRAISSVQLRVAGGLSLSYTTLAHCLLIGAIVVVLLILGASVSVPGVDGALDEGIINSRASYYAPEFALVAASLEAKTTSFLCDSGCSASTCNTKALFDCLFPSKTRMLTGDNVLTTAAGVGNVSTYSMCTVKGKEVPIKLNIQCLYMPNFAYNLLSVNSLNANGCGVYFPPAKKQGAYIEFEAGHRIYLRKQGKLWYLDMTTPSWRIHHATWFNRSCRTIS